MATTAQEVYPDKEPSTSTSDKKEDEQKQPPDQSDIASEPWHELDVSEWNEKGMERLLKEVEGYTPIKQNDIPSEKIPNVNFLLMGRISSGKSSFVNTVDSVLKGRLSIRSRAGCSGSSLTKSLDIYKLKTSKQQPLNFRLYDCRGLEEEQSLNSRDVEAILDGHVLHDYVFNQSTPITKDCIKFRKDPNMADRVHCVLFVIDGSIPPEITMSQNVEKQIKEFQEMMNRKKIPQLILLTKMDILSTIKGDVSKLIRSKSVQEMREKVAMSLGLPPYTVLPMQNIANSRTVSTDLKILTLYNLCQALHAADDYLENFEDEIMADIYKGAQVKSNRD
ncbi:interferon-induced protein 44-like isoform X1 [Ostrea edulis]|uniref:interferon-induced protein 44-like isoform X1 n=1 Tax=Ostrea edulis TaxID=37623 RepID=UPI0024AF698A|nr:interferon-induced protein 44-like isoform X1 [Ostrea edulis]XP_056021767.1 interferon-induced protein 44-like isoform X1 [Ostrea edulis]